MCGLIGAYKSNEEVDVQSIYHRGPDAQKLIQWGDFKVGHTRLSIIDTHAAANQPFEYEDTIIAFNGEIYNYQELRATYLKDYEDEFRTNSDTEVLIMMLFHYGLDKTLEVIDGMFCFFYADNGNTRVLVRDRYGKIPLFFENNEDTSEFLWCSEQKGFKKHMTEFPRANYYDFNTGEFVEYYSYVKDEYKPFTLEVMEEAVRKRLIADVPLCCLISGGLDSSLILALAKKHNPNIVAYTAVYDKNSNDFINAKKVCKEFDVELRVVYIEPPTKQDIENTVKSIETKMKAQVEISLLNLPLAKAISEDGFKVVLSGEGADEIFGGYGNFAIQASRAETHEDWREIKKAQVDKMARGNFRRANMVFMQYQIECRLPFIDKDIVEFGINATREENPVGKKILKEIAEGIVPEYIIKRAKETFQGSAKIPEYIEEIYGNPIKMYNQIYKNMYKKKLKKLF
jgi:asparagine synthase (glutamine-hydrolysing)